MLALRARSPCLFARGRCPLCTPFVGAQLPKQVARLGFYPQSGGRSAPPTPGDFPVAGKVTKGAPRAAPFGIPRCTTKDRFATLRWWANRSFFLPELYLGSHLLLSIRGAAVSLWIACRPEFLPFLGGAARRAAGGMIMPPKGSTQRGYPSGRFFGDFLIGEKVTRVQGGAPASGCWDCRPAKAPGRRAERLHIGERGGAPPRKKGYPAIAAASACSRQPVRSRSSC